VPFVLPIVREIMFRQWDKNHSFIKRGSLLGKILTKRALAGMKSQIPEGPLRDILIPKYAPGCKRLIMSSTYLPALQRPNVYPITAPIESITPEGVRTADGREHSFDILVLATGYKNFNIAASMNVIGPDGVNLADIWQSRAVTHRTVAIPGFPNFFIMMGPNTGSGHHSATFAIEIQARYIRKCVITLWKRGIKSMTPKTAAAEAFYDHVQQELGETVLTDNCQAWYKNGEGGKVHSIWPGTTSAYRELLKEPALEEFELTR
jgi:cation diffusion facilitator CzcD-associated flavoprotein CzcO